MILNNLSDKIFLPTRSNYANKHSSAAAKADCRLLHLFLYSNVYSKFST